MAKVANFLHEPFLAAAGSALKFKLSREEASNTQRCCKCGGDAKEFKDAASAREYAMTLWCQACQDHFFG